jgi:MFS family permease
VAQDCSPTSYGHRERDRLRSLRNHNFRLYSAGQLVAVSGTWAQRVALDWLVLGLSGSGAVLGLVSALQFAPSLVLAPWAGLLADRFDRRRLLMATQLSFALAAVVLSVLAFSGALRLWHLVVAAGLLGAVVALDTPLRHSFVGEMVRREQLPHAVAINSITYNGGRVLGPAVGAVLLAGPGVGWAVAVGASTVASFVGLQRMRQEDLFPVERAAAGRGQIAAGVRYVLDRPDLRITLLVALGAGAFPLNAQVALAVLARDTYDVGGSGYGLLSAALAAGACLGAVAATVRHRRARLRFIGAAGGVLAALTALVGAMPTYVTTVVVLVPMGAGTLVLLTSANSSVQLGTSSTMRGRVMALYMMCLLGGTALGAPVVGWWASVLGPRAALGLSGAAYVAVLAGAASWAAHSSRRLSAPTR